MQSNPMNTKWPQFVPLRQGQLESVHQSLLWHIASSILLTLHLPSSGHCQAEVFHLIVLKRVLPSLSTHLLQLPSDQLFGAQGGGVRLKHCVSNAVYTGTKNTYDSHLLWPPDQLGKGTGLALVLLSSSSGTRGDT